MPALPNPKHELFAQGLAEGNSQAEAYRNAGYSDHRASAHALAQRPDISERVAELRERAAVNEAKAIARASEKLALTKEKVLRGLMNIAFADVRKIAKWNDDGMLVMPSDMIPDDEALAIAEVTVDRGGKPRIKLHDKLQALQLLGRHLAMFKEHVEIGGELVNNIEADSVRQIILSRIALIAQRSAENDNAERDVSGGTDEASVGLGDVGSAEPTAA